MSLRRRNLVATALVLASAPLVRADCDADSYMGCLTNQLAIVFIIFGAVTAVLVVLTLWHRVRVRRAFAANMARTDATGLPPGWVRGPGLARPAQAHVVGPMPAYMAPPSGPPPDPEDVYAPPPPSYEPKGEPLPPPAGAPPPSGPPPRFEDSV